MALNLLDKLKAQLKQFLYSIFIQPIVDAWNVAIAEPAQAEAPKPLDNPSTAPVTKLASEFVPTPEQQRAAQEKFTRDVLNADGMIAASRSNDQKEPISAFDPLAADLRRARAGAEAPKPRPTDEQAAAPAKTESWLARTMREAETEVAREHQREAKARRGIYQGERPIKTEVSSKGFVVYERWENEDGEIHRKDGPSVVERDPVTGRVLLEEWYKDGKLHRDNGPAIIHYNEDGPGIESQSWWKGGEMLPIVSDLEQLRNLFGHKPGEGRKLPGEITPEDERRNRAALDVLEAQKAARPRPSTAPARSEDWLTRQVREARAELAKDEPQEAARPRPMGRGRERTLDF